MTDDKIENKRQHVLTLDETTSIEVLDDDSKEKIDLTKYKCAICSGTPTNFFGFINVFIKHGYTLVFYCDDDDCADIASMCINQYGSVFYFGTKLSFSIYHDVKYENSILNPIFLSSFGEKILSRRLDKIVKRDNVNEANIGYYCSYYNGKKELFRQICKNCSIHISGKPRLLAWPHCQTCLKDKQKEEKYGCECEYCYFNEDEENNLDLYEKN
jgi:hypothetical protein